jgi:hypothetical protein
MKSYLLKFVFNSIVLSGLTWLGTGYINISSVKAEQISLSPQFSPDPIRLKGQSGGLVRANSITNLAETATGSCDGFVREEPNHILTLTSFFNFLKLEVESKQDTTIIVKGPGGSWCSDDSQGKNPEIAGQWQQGTYRIWVGSYQKNNSLPYTIKITKQP